MLLLSVSLTAQVKTTKHWNGVIAKQWSVDTDGNYNGAYAEWTQRGVIIVKSNYLHGELHGNYVSYFDNGVPSEESTYYKGTLTSQKKYRYFGAKRYLMRSATWLKDGTLLTEGMRLYNDYTGLGDWIDTAGKLPNGYWSLSGYTESANYTEKYNGNDTTYVWFDKTKKQFKGKGIDGKGYFVVYDKDGTLLRSPELTLKIERERIKQDSIVEVNKLIEKQRIAKEKQQYLLKKQIEQQNLVAMLCQPDTLYRDVVNKYVSGNEQKLFKFIYEQLKSRKPNAGLYGLIAQSIKVYSNVDVIDRKARSYNLQEDTSIVGSYPSSIGSGYYAERPQYDDKIVLLVPCLSTNQTDITNLEAIDKDALPKKTRILYETKTKLVDIIQYCNDNNIEIK